MWLLALLPLVQAPTASDLPPQLRRDPATNEWILEPEVLELVRSDPELGEAIRAGLDFVALGFDAARPFSLGSHDLERKRAVTVRREQIREEIEALGEHDWAGVYGGGGGYEGYILEIAPSAGAAYEYWACMTADFNHGDIASFEEGRFRLELAFEPGSRGHVFDHHLARPFLTNEWYLVRWGQQRYLVPSSQMIPFCKAVPDRRSWTGFHRFPVRTKTDASAIPRENDWRGELPDVPPPYRRYLLERAIDCTIIEAGEPIDGPPRLRTPGAGYRFHIVRTKVDAGAAQGLLPGMTLRVIESDIRRPVGEVVHVGATSSVVDFRDMLREETDPEGRIPRVGWRLRAGP